MTIIHQGELRLRAALPSDIDELEELEYDSVDDEMFSRRQWRHLLTDAHAITLVLEDTRAKWVPEQHLLGYGMVLFRRNSGHARLYSLAVHPEIRSQGCGTRLLTELERCAVMRQRQYMVLEVRADNRVALRMYRHHGYRALRWVDDYYSDDCAAYRMIKLLGGQDSQ